MFRNHFRAAVVLAALIPALRAEAALRVELVTIEAGDPIWTRCGHVGLRVIDDEAGRDLLYSYGYAPFDQPDFLWGYLRGESEFFLAAQRWERSLGRYIEQDRTVRVRSLNLAPAQLTALAERLEENARPENRGYRYQHLTDNCSTRVRDLLDDISGGALRRAAAQREPGDDYRDYTLEAGSGRTVMQIIFDLIGEPSQERDVDGWAQLYLPIYLEEAAVEAQLAGDAVTTYERRAAPATTGKRLLGRYWLLGTAVVLGASLALLGRRRASRVAARLHGLLLLPILLVTGVVGLALLGLVVVSRVPDFAWNENVLVYWPTHLAGAWLGLRSLATGRGGGRIWRAYLRVHLGALALYAVLKLSGAFPQDNWVFLAAASALALGELAGARASDAPGASPASVP